MQPNSGGELYVTSPGGYQYPRPLSWDLSARDLESALEWTFDVREVSVTYAEDANTTRSYRITFEVRIQASRDQIELSM